MVLGGFHPQSDTDHLPAGTQTFVLLGPGPDGFWDRIIASPEFLDGDPDPIDRWSKRVIDALAADNGAQALYPFGGPPWLPFLRWATESSGLWQSPAGMLVHDTAGLMVSIRGALALPTRVELPKSRHKPCDSCHVPCLKVCPVSALKGDKYDTDACRAHLLTPAGHDCIQWGCRARRVCPVSEGAGRTAAQSAYHMARFLGAST